MILRTLVTLVSLWALTPGAAAAQPVVFQLRNNVPAGKKPSLTITAVQRVVGLELDLVRSEDGGKVSERAAALKPKQSITFELGDGAVGRAHYQGTLKLVVS